MANKTKEHKPKPKPRTNGTFEATFIFKQKFVNCSHWTRVQTVCVCVFLLCDSSDLLSACLCSTWKARACCCFCCCYCSLLLLPLPSLLFFRYYFIVVILFYFFASFVCSFSQRFYQITFWVKIFAPHMPHIAHYTLAERVFPFKSFRSALRNSYIFAGAGELQKHFSRIECESHAKSAYKMKSNRTEQTNEMEGIWSILLKCLFSIRFGLKEFKL